MKEIVNAMVKAIKATDKAMARAIKEHDALMVSYASKKEAYEDVIRQNVCLITDLNEIVGNSPYDLIALNHDRQVVDIPDYERNIVTDADGVGRMEVIDGGVRVYYDDKHNAYYRTTNDRYGGKYTERLDISGFYNPDNPLNEE
jgi:hypothetical protein